MEKRAQTLIRLVAAALFAAALITELRKPRQERTWHGSIAGLVPYEFRPPPIARVRERWWNPDDDRVLTEHVFGVGWSINLARIARFLRGLAP
jgi:Family of unknown function (DUF5808)